MLDTTFGTFLTAPDAGVADDLAIALLNRDGSTRRVGHECGATDDDLLNSTPWMKMDGGNKPDIIVVPPGMKIYVSSMRKENYEYLAKGRCGVVMFEDATNGKNSERVDVANDCMIFVRRIGPAQQQQQQQQVQHDSHEVDADMLTQLPRPVHTDAQCAVQKTGKIFPTKTHRHTIPFLQKAREFREIIIRPTKARM